MFNLFTNTLKDWYASEEKGEESINLHTNDYLSENSASTLTTTSKTLNPSSSDDNNNVDVDKSPMNAEKKIADTIYSHTTAGLSEAKQRVEHFKNLVSDSKMFTLSTLKDKVQKTAFTIKDRLPNTNMISALEKEQKKFQDEVLLQNNDKENVSVINGIAPWIGFENEDEVKEQILSISSDERAFLQSPPTSCEFSFDFVKMSGTAKLLLSEDKNLTHIRFKLVPKMIKEYDFWRNYFYRVSLIKEANKFTPEPLVSQNIKCQISSPVKLAENKGKVERIHENILSDELKEFEVLGKEESIDKEFNAIFKDE